MNPNNMVFGMTSAVSIVYTGNRALQLMNGVMSMVSSLSFLFSMFLALMMAGTAQAKPLIIGITLFPFRPTLRISLGDDPGATLVEVLDAIGALAAAVGPLPTALPQAEAAAAA